MNYEEASKILVANLFQLNELNELKHLQKEIQHKISLINIKLRNNHKGFVNSKIFLSQRQKYINHLEKIHPEIKYISGYKMGGHDKNKNFKVLLLDKSSGIRFYASASNLRKPSWHPNIATKNKSFIFEDDLAKWYPIAGRNKKGVKIKVKPILFTQCKNCGKTFE